MLILIVALLSFAGFLFLSSSGGFLTLREMTALYSVAVLLTLVSQVHARFHQCEGIAGCSVSFAKAIVWSGIWPISWIVNFRGL